jgi:predicted ester cyclase
MFRQARWWLVALLALAVLGAASGAWAQEDGASAAQANAAEVLAWLAALGGKDSGMSMIPAGDTALWAHLAWIEDTFPGFELDVDDVIASGEGVAVHATFRGPQMGAVEGIPPPGQYIELPISLFVHVYGGQIGEYWMQTDIASLQAQLRFAAQVHAASDFSDALPLDCGTLQSVKHGM